MRPALLGILLVSSALGSSSGTFEVRDVLGPSARPSFSVLFLGNSLSHVDDVPAPTRSLAVSRAMQARLTVSSVTAGGATLSEHRRSGDAVRALRAPRPDVLARQAQSTEPLTSPADFSRHARRLKAEADSFGAVEAAPNGP